MNRGRKQLTLGRTFVPLGFGWHASQAHNELDGIRDSCFKLSVQGAPGGVHLDVV